MKTQNEPSHLDKSDFAKRKEKKLLTIDKLITKLGYTHDQIHELLAISWVEQEEMERIIEEQMEIIRAAELSLHTFSTGIEGDCGKIQQALLELQASHRNTTAKSLLAGIKLQKTLGARQSGIAGARNRHAPMRALEKWAVEKYKAGTWKSANAAAHSLKDSIIEYGRGVGANLTPQNAQRTIAEWFRRSV